MIPLPLQAKNKTARRRFVANNWDLTPIKWTLKIESVGKAGGYLPQSEASGAAQMLSPKGMVSSPSYSKRPILN